MAIAARNKTTPTQNSGEWWMRLESSCFFLVIALTIRSTHESVGNCRGRQCVLYNSTYGAASAVHLPCVTARSDLKGPSSRKRST